MLRDFVKLSLWNLGCNILLFVCGDLYGEQFLWILAAFCAAVELAIILLYSSTDASTPILVFYFFIPLTSIIVSLKYGGFRKNISMILLFSELLCLLTVFRRHQDLTVIVHRLQQRDARQTGCPGH